MCGGLNVSAQFVKTVNCGELVFFFAMSRFHSENAVEVERTPVGSVCLCPGAVCYRVRGTALLHWELDL